MDRILGAEIDHQTREEQTPEWARVRIHATADR
jgi:hypothetical protein